MIAAGIRAAHDDAPDFESVKHAIVEEGFNERALVAAEFLGNALGDAAPTGGQAKEARAPGKTA